jgi:mevalonate kinase
MNNFDKNMEEIFDVTPTEPKKAQPIVTTHYNPPSDDKQDLVDAYQQSKENIQEIIDSGKDAMEEILQIAKAGQHPRAFEVYATLLKNMTEANDRLLKIQKEMREIEGRKKDSGTTIDKAIFVGSTSELSKFLKGNNGS